MNNFIDAEIFVKIQNALHIFFSWVDVIVDKFIAFVTSVILPSKVNLILTGTIVVFFIIVIVLLQRKHRIHLYQKMVGEEQQNINYCEKVIHSLLSTSNPSYARLEEAFESYAYSIRQISHLVSGNPSGYPKDPSLHFDIMLLFTSISRLKYLEEVGRETNQHTKYISMEHIGNIMIDVLYMELCQRHHTYLNPMKLNIKEIQTVMREVFKKLAQNSTEETVNKMQFDGGEKIVQQMKDQYQQVKMENQILQDQRNQMNQQMQDQMLQDQMNQQMQDQMLQDQMNQQMQNQILQDQQIQTQQQMQQMDLQMQQQMDLQMQQQIEQQMQQQIEQQMQQQIEQQMQQQMQQQMEQQMQDQMNQQMNDMNNFGGPSGFGF